MLLPGALKPQKLINSHIKDRIQAHAPTLTPGVSILPQHPPPELETLTVVGGGGATHFLLKRGVIKGVRHLYICCSSAQKGMLLP